MNEKVEEEDVPNYKSEDYYPAHIGDMFGTRYQIVSKLGFGMKSTVWLCRDLWKVKHYDQTQAVELAANALIGSTDISP